MKLNNMKRKIELTPKELERKAMLKVINQIHKLKSKLADMSNEYVKQYCPIKEGAEFKWEYVDEHTYTVAHKVHFLYNAVDDQFEFVGYPSEGAPTFDALTFSEDEVTFL